jgi:hypothetical protein
MATLAPHAPRFARNDDRFYFGLSVAMALVIVAGFSFQLAMGRSSFRVPLVWHVHGVVFMTWIGLFLTQTWLATGGSMALHRRLGWLAAGWVLLMMAMGTAVTVATVQRGTAPFFFQPQHFLIANPLGLLCFAGLTFTAIRLRRQRDWHRRLQICAFAALVGPGIGRLLPMPFLTPVAFEVAVGAGMLFPAFAMVREYRREGRIHPAWWWGEGAIGGTLVVAALLAYSPVGNAIYAMTVAGAPGAKVPGLAFGAFPPGL